MGVDNTLSLATRSAFESVCQCLEQEPSDCRLILLHVIPLPYDPRSRGRPAGSTSTYSPTQSQIRESRHLLRRAHALLGQLGVPLDSVELLLLAGTPAEELARVARERDVDLLVLGCRPHSRLSFLRRLLLGSTSRRVLHLAPCRVLLAHPPQLSGSDELVAWYERALLRCLQQATALMVLTPGDVARCFAPGIRASGQREVEAATCALQHLANRGLLLCQQTDGEVRCWND